MNTYKCTDSYVKIEFPFESRQCVINKESDAENVKEQAPKIGTTNGEINKLKCIDHNNDIKSLIL